MSGTTYVRAAFGPLAAGVRNGFADYAAVFTWRSWSVGWLARLASHAALYGLLGKMLGSETHQRYLFVGASMLVCAGEALLVCASTVSERCTGTLSLIEAAPAGSFGVLAGRGMQFLPGGVVTALACLLLIGPAFHLRWTPVQVTALLPLVVLTSVTTYCVGLALGAVVLSAPDLRNVVTGVVAAASPVACGVVAPLQQWPPAVRAVGMTLPLTHTLAAVRRVADGGVSAACVGEAAAALVAAAGWLLVARLIVRWTLDAARRRGSMEIGG